MSRPVFVRFKPPPTPSIFALSLHDALPISHRPGAGGHRQPCPGADRAGARDARRVLPFLSRERSRRGLRRRRRSEEHTSELQSRQYLVCRLLLEQKKIKYRLPRTNSTTLVV